MSTEATEALKRLEPIVRILLTVDEAAAALGISEKSLRERSLSGEIPSFTIGDRRLYSVDALREWARAKAMEGLRKERA